MKLHWTIVLAVVAFLCLLSRESFAGGTKDECVDAHGRGQDLRERGQLVRAKQTFLTCAQSSCPALVQGDCARFGEDLAHLVPTIGFGARDKSANDLPNTSVYVDDALLATRLDDGKLFEVDPGRHTIRYVNAGREQTLHVIVNQGEKGRLFVARFIDVDGPGRESDASPAAKASAPGRPRLPLVVAGVGLAAAATGAVLTGIGLSGVPDNCSTSTHACVAPRGDKSIEKAHDAMATANIGLTVASIGAVALVGGIIWYFVQPNEAGKKSVTSLAPGLRF